MATDKKDEAKAPAKLKVGDEVILTGVHGIMVNPDDAKNVLGDGRMAKVTIDQWYLDQLDAGKLVVCD